ncbi:MAG: cytochrome b/b6 domain-containing protein [bacterium]
MKLTREDRRWLRLKPGAMLGAPADPLPPQDKYNAGQKLFALLVLAATAIIVLTGSVMSFHLGPPGLVASAMLLHKLAAALVLVGLSVHVTMAAVLSEERPALKSMITGRIDRTFAQGRNAKWVARRARPASKEK